MTPSTLTSPSPNFRTYLRYGIYLVVGAALYQATTVFLQIEHDGGTRWLICILCILALIQIVALRQYLLGITCFTLLTCYWLLFAGVSGSLPILFAAAIATALCAAALWISSLWKHPTDIILPAAIFFCGIMTSAFIPASLIVATTIAIVPFMLLLPLTLTKEACGHAQYLTLLTIITVAAWSVSSSAILFT